MSKASKQKGHKRKAADISKKPKYSISDVMKMFPGMSYGKAVLEMRKKGLEL